MTVQTSSGITAADRAARLRCMLFDIDGVLTDGCLHYQADGETTKVFHVHGGHGIKMLRDAGIVVGVVSGRHSAAAERRTRELGIEHRRLGIADKLADVGELLFEIGIDWTETGFMGDDWVDLAVMRRVGFAATVADAASGMEQSSHWVSRRPGGHGAVREVSEFILAAQGKLDAVFDTHCRAGMAQG
ncbi:HAD family hydrolase [soil metagenome]